MTDVLDEGLAAFDRELGIEPGTEEAAEETTAEETTEEVATPEAESTDERPRNPDGTFAKAETEPESDVVDMDDHIDPKFVSYLERFGAKTEVFELLSPEVQKAIRAGYEADGMIGRQGQELGEFKKMLEQVQEQTAPQPSQPQQYDPDAIADHFAEHPESILPTIQQAYANGDPERADMNLVYLALHALDDVNPVLAKAIEVDIAKRAAIAEMSPHIERGVQQDFNQSFAGAWNTVKATYPDIDQYADQIIQAAEQDPALAAGLTEGTPESQQRVLTSLYKIAAFDASSRDSSTLAQARATATAEQQAETEAAKREGFVATGAQRVDTEPVDPGEQWIRDLGVDDYLSKHGYAQDT